jgi:hypothetical protein
MAGDLYFDAAAIRLHYEYPLSGEDYNAVPIAK